MAVHRAQGFDEAGAVRVVAPHGLAVVAPVPCVGDEPIGHERGWRTIIQAESPLARYASSRMNGHHFPFARDPFAARFFSPLTMRASSWLTVAAVW